MKKMGGEQKIIGYINLIKKGYTSFIPKAKQLVEEYPHYKGQLEEAIRAGRKEELLLYLDLIKDGDVLCIPHAEKLVEEYPNYEGQLEEAIRTGKNKLELYRDRN